MDLAELTREANELLAEGFNAIDQSWRDRCEIVPARDFQPLGALNIESYAHMISFSADEVASGAYKASFRRLGRDAGSLFLRLFNERAGDGRAVVAYLEGTLTPQCTATQEADGKYVVRCYHDFGIQKAQEVGV